MKKLSLFLLLVAISITAFAKVTVAQPVPLYIEDAFKKAALPADAKGKWVIQADVNIHKPDGSTIQGGGDLRLDGNVLVGYLALQIYQGSYIKDQTMWLSIMKSTPIVVAIRHEIAGKPYLGRPAETARLKNLYTTPFSNGKVVWDNEDCNVSIYLTPRQVKTSGTVAVRKPPTPTTNATQSVPTDKSWIIPTGTTLIKGHQYRSQNEHYALICQTDGNLVLYTARPKTRNIYDAVWSTRSEGTQSTCNFQHDGNLVIYRQGFPLWNSRKNAKSNEDKNESWLDNLPPYGIDSMSKRSSMTAAQYWLYVQNDGNVVIYAGTYPNGTPIWASKSN